MAGWNSLQATVSTPRLSLVMSEFRQERQRDLPRSTMLKFMWSELTTNCVVCQEVGRSRTFANGTEHASARIVGCLPSGASADGPLTLFRPQCSAVRTQESTPPAPFGIGPPATSIGRTLHQILWDVKRDGGRREIRTHSRKLMRGLGLAIRPDSRSGSLPEWSTVSGSN
jgi:hypothetical protein